MSEIPKAFGFPVESLGRFDTTTLLKLLRALAQFRKEVLGATESTPSVLLAAGAVLRQWPYRFLVLMRRAHREFGDVAFVDLLFDREKGLINERTRRSASDVNPFQFLIEATRKFVVGAGLAALVDRRILVNISGPEELAAYSVTGISQQVGLDSRATRRLISRGTLRAAKNARGRFVVDPRDVEAIKERWKTTSIRNASRALGISVGTFRCCLAEGLIEATPLQGELRGYSISEIKEFGRHLDNAAAKCHANLDASAPALSDLMGSSLYTTSFKFSVLQDLLSGRLAHLATGANFKKLRVHGSIVGLGAMASGSIKGGQIVSAYAEELLMCSRLVLSRLSDEGLVPAERRGRLILVDLSSLQKFASRWISHQEICNSLGWDFRSRRLQELLSKFGNPLRFGRTAFFSRRRVPDLEELALLVFRKC